MQRVQQKQFYWDETLFFSWMLLRASLRNRQMIFISLLTPLLLFSIFYVSQGQEGLLLMFPIIVGFPTMFSGSTLASRLVNWREQDIFKRLAVTPTPLGYLIGGMVLVQVVINTLQVALLLILFQITLGESIHLTMAELGLLLMVTIAGNLCFVTFGAVIATIAQQVESVNMIYMLSVLPTMFLGGAVITVPILEQIASYLPTTLLTNSLNLLIGSDGTDIGRVLVSIFALLLYAVFFTGVAISRFKWD